MTFKKLFNKIRYMFNNEIVGVQAPYASMDENNNIVCWTLDVEYKHHGKKSYLFNVNDECWYGTHGNPQAAAQAAYKEYFGLMQRQRAKQLAHQR